MAFDTNPSCLCNRPDYFGPGCNITSADMIGVGRKTASGADEVGLRSPVRLVYVSTLGARPTRVARVHSLKGHPRQSSLVGKERSQLEERPGMQHAPLSFSYGYPSSDAREVLDGDSATGVFSFADYCLTDHVVGVGMEVCLPSSELAQMPFGALGARPLKSCSELGVPTTRGKHSFARMRQTVRINGEVSDAQVHAQPFLGTYGRAVGHLDSHEKVEASLSIDQVRLTSCAVEPSTVVFADCTRDNHASINCEEAHTIKPFFEAINPLVIGDSSEWFECATLRPIATVDLADLRYCSNGMLGRQAINFAKISVIELLETNLVGRFQFEGTLREPAARLIHPPHRFQKTGLLVGVYEQLHCCDKLHAHGRTRTMDKCNTKSERRFLPRLPSEAGASTPKIR